MVRFWTVARSRSSGSLRSNWLACAYWSYRDFVARSILTVLSGNLAEDGIIAGCANFVGPVECARMIAGSLFSGLGGFELGFHWAGIPTAWSVEIDPLRRQVLRAHFDRTRIYSDVHYVDIERDLGYVNIICGGFPCQDTSNQGGRRGLEGKKSSLWFNFLDIIRELRPEYVVVENVSGLRARGMGRVISGLAEIGYVGEWESIPASILGALHERDRVWIVAHLPDTRVDTRRALSVQQERALADPGSIAVGTDGRRSVLPDPIWEKSPSDGGRAPGPVSLGDVDLASNASTIFDAHALTAFARLCAPHWANQPPVRRLDDGIPRQLDGHQQRISALGDSLVPQMAAFIGFRIRLHAGRSGQFPLFGPIPTLG